MDTAVDTSVALLSRSQSFSNLVAVLVEFSLRSLRAFHAACFASHSAVFLAFSCCLASHSCVFLALSSCLASHSDFLLAASALRCACCLPIWQKKGFKVQSLA